MRDAVVIDRISKRYTIGAKFDRRSFREVVSGLLSGRRETPEERTLWALRDVSFRVEDGEATAIIGRNGAGKSTLLKILSRITEPTAGAITVRGRVSSLLEVGTGFHGSLTGRENIHLNGAILGMTRKEIRERFDEIVAFSEIGRLIDTPVKYYSTGMYLRLAFAVAAHLEPEVLVVDEVLAVGDAAFQRKCLRKMRDVASGGRTVLFVSHNVPAVRALCKNAVWLKEGMVAGYGPANEIVDRYLQHSVGPEAQEDVQSSIDAFPEDPVFRLREIALLQNGRRCSVVESGAPVDVEIAYDVYTTTIGIYLSVALYDLDETLLFESRAPVMNAGSYAARVVIPANLLASRPYQLRIDAGIANVRRCVPDPVRIHFEVLPSGSAESAARLAPQLEWSVVKLDRERAREHTIRSSR